MEGYRYLKILLKKKNIGIWKFSKVYSLSLVEHPYGYVWFKLAKPIFGQTLKFDSNLDRFLYSKAELERPKRPPQFWSPIFWLQPSQGQCWPAKAKPNFASSGHDPKKPFMAIQYDCLLRWKMKNFRYTRPKGVMDSWTVCGCWSPLTIGNVWRAGAHLTPERDGLEPPLPLFRSWSLA